ncbi:MAG: hypothetical protein ACRD82_06245 [Blastocatellia bacterium]
MVAGLLAEPETAVAETLLEGLRRLPIRIPRPAAVRDYLLRYPDLCGLEPGQPPSI